MPYVYSNNTLIMFIVLSQWPKQFWKFTQIMDNDYLAKVDTDCCNFIGLFKPSTAAMHLKPTFMTADKYRVTVEVQFCHSILTNWRKSSSSLYPVQYCCQTMNTQKPNYIVTSHMQKCPKIRVQCICSVHDAGRQSVYFINWVIKSPVQFTN